MDQEMNYRMKTAILMLLKSDVQVSSPFALWVLHSAKKLFILFNMAVHTGFLTFFGDFQ